MADKFIDEKTEELDEKIRILEERKKQYIKKEKAKIRQARTHRFCQLGGMIEKIAGRPLVDEDIERIERFLLKQNDNGGYFAKALDVDVKTDM